MADIFVSYARADKERVEPLVAALEAKGFSVWWDPAITPGQEFDRKISQELDAAKAVIVVWTPLSVDSRWVRGEAREAADRGVLVPVRFEQARLPIDVRSLHTTDLDGWKGDAAGAPFQELLRAVTALLRSETAAGGAAAQPATAAPTPARPSRFKLWHGAALAGVICIAAAAIIFAGQKHALAPTEANASASSPSPSQAQTAKPRIAVMPFENLSPDPANAFFTDGMHEEILTALSNNAPGLEVVSRTTMMTFKGKTVTAHDVAKQLGATHVLEGSVRRDGDQVRVTLQLTDGATDNHIWSKDYDRTLNDALTLQTEVASAVADQLSMTVLQAAEDAKRPTTNAKAYDLYLKALLDMPQPIGSTTAQFTSTDDLLKEAIALDPNFALAHAARVYLRYIAFISNNDVSEESVKLWRSELDEAARLAPQDPRVLSSQGNYAYEVDRDFISALRFYEQVEARGLIDPISSSEKYNVLLAMGRIDEAISLGRRLLEADPQSLAAAVPVVYGLWVSHKNDEAVHVILTGPSRLTPLPVMAKWYFKGEADPSSPLLPRPGEAPTPNATPDDLSPRLVYETSRYSGRLKEFKALLDKMPFDTVRMDTFVIFQIPGIGRQPVADIRGWTDLQLGDKAGAAAQSKPILDFLANTKETKWNLWFLRVLKADAALFAGDKASAIASAKEAMNLMPCSADAMRCLFPEVLGAQVLAWAGDEDEAAALLETLGLGVPGIAPAQVARDPIFTIPLANNARYRALKAKLDAQMAATKFE